MERFKKFTITTLLGGFVVLLPLAIFVMLLKLIISLVAGLLAPLSNLIKNELNLQVPDLLVSFLAFVIVIFLCFMIGLFIRTRFGKDSFVYFERTYLFKLPLYGTIKETVQQFTGTKKMPFSDIVLVDVFSNGTRMTGFVTDEHESGNLTVFVPTGPNPTNGFIFHVTKDQVTRVDDSIKIDDAMRTIIGVGVGSSGVIKF